MRRAAEAGNEVTAPVPASPDGVAGNESFPVESGSSSGAVANDGRQDDSGSVAVNGASDGLHADSHQVAETQAEPSLGSHFGPGLVEKIVVDSKMLPASREQYRRLAAALHHAQEATGLRVVMLASAVASEGKSLTAANLALTLSESYRRRVLLVDGDLRRPSLHRMFGLEADNGLSSALDGPEGGRLTLFDLSPTLTLLPAGRPTSDPMASLTSVRMRALIDEARERFDWIVIDTPPVGMLSDASLLSSIVDGVLLVIRANRTPYQLVQRAVEALGTERLLGTVLNRASEDSTHSAYSYYKYYSAPREAEGT
jgi:capsular exopolysaccharide synthesis family protein